MRRPMRVGPMRATAADAMTQTAQAMNHMDGGTVSQANVDAVVEGSGTVAQAVVVATMEAERCGCSSLPKHRVIWHDAWNALGG